MHTGFYVVFGEPLNGAPDFRMPRVIPAVAQGWQTGFPIDSRVERALPAKRHDVATSANLSGLNGAHKCRDIANGVGWFAVMSGMPKRILDPKGHTDVIGVVTQFDVQLAFFGDPGG